MDKESILRKLRLYKKDIEAFDVSQIGLFGSFASGSADEDSDIDIYIIFKENGAIYDNFLNLYDFLESLFPGKKIDIVTKGGLNSYFEPEILEDTIYV